MCDPERVEPRRASLINVATTRAHVLRTSGRTDISGNVKGTGIELERLTVGVTLGQVARDPVTSQLFAASLLQLYRSDTLGQ